MSTYEPDKVPRIEGYDAPELITILVQALLFRLGGQHSFTMTELNDIIASYDSMRLALDEKTETLTLTIRPKKL